MSVRITILADEHTTQDEGLLAEHGLSLLFEGDESKALLDAGQTDVCLQNAARLGAELADLRRVVLSHGHYDHGGGLPALLDQLGSLEVFAHPDVFAARYARRPGEQDRYIGLAYDAEELTGRGAVMRLEPGPQEIGRDFLTTGAIPRTTDFEDANPAFQVKNGGKWETDPLDDDQGVIARTTEGLVVLLGCAHAGVINTLHQATRLTGDDRIRAVVGGLHLVGASEERIQRTVAALRDLDVGTVAACHCTGFPAMTRLHAAFGERFVNGAVGLRLTF